MTIKRDHIDKVFSQKFSLLDLEMLEKYLEDPKLSDEVKPIIRKQWEQFSPDLDDNPDLDNIFYKLYYTLDNSGQSPRKPTLFIRISKIAAILVVALFSAIATAYFLNKTNKDIYNNAIEIVSHDGFRSQFSLPDGTTGWLGYKSSIKYYEGQSRRVVELDGLAFFDVQPQENQFVVKTPTNLDIEVIGTKFNVYSYAEENLCDVVLQQGNIKLVIDGQNIQNMTPDERIIYRSKTNSIEKMEDIENIDDFLAWKDGNLILNNVSLEEACVKLSRFYNVDFECSVEKNNNSMIQLTLENETLEEALKLLSMISPISYHIERQKVLDNKSYTKKKIIIKNK